MNQLVRKRIKGDVPNIKGRIPTIFDYARSPVDINVPCYSEDAYEEQRHEIAYGLGNPIVEKQLAQKYWKTFKKKREKVLNAFNKAWDLFMVHFFLPDIIQHILWYRENEIRKLYTEMDETAHLIEKCLGENALIIFVSDHGQKRGLHTPYGFYSCNQKLNLREPKITDFADIIKRELGAPTKNEIEQVKKRLEKLGYF